MARTKELDRVINDKRGRVTDFDNMHVVLPMTTDRECIV